MVNRIRSLFTLTQYQISRRPTNKSWTAGAVECCQMADKAIPRIPAQALRRSAASLAVSAGANVKAENYGLPAIIKRG
jgi:hypothetical protein